MGGADWAILVVVVVLFVASIFFAASETAFTRMSRIRTCTWSSRPWAMTASG